MRGSSAAHTALCRAILLELGALPGVIIGLNPSGRAKYVDEHTGRTSVVPYGWPTPEGGPDLLAVVNGRLVGLEVKTGAATTTKDQRAVHEALRAVGVAVHVVRSVEDGRSAIASLLRIDIVEIGSGSASAKSPSYSSIPAT